MSSDVRTWRHLEKRIAELTERQKDQPIQVLKFNGGSRDVNPLLPGVAFATAQCMQIQAARSTYDNKYHPDDLLLLVDGNKFSEDGAMTHRLKNGELTPIYTGDGPTKRCDQTAPNAYELDANSFTNDIIFVMKYRTNVDICVE